MSVPTIVASVFFSFNEDRDQGLLDAKAWRDQLAPVGSMYDDSYDEFYTSRVLNGRRESFRLREPAWRELFLRRSFESFAKSF
jgi:hypothetical protein